MIIFFLSTDLHKLTRKELKKELEKISVIRGKRKIRENQWTKKVQRQTRLPFHRLIINH